MSTSTSTRTALVTGASGYVGGQLVPQLLQAGWEVRVLTRSAGSIADRPWADDVEVVEGDADDSSTLRRALRDIDVGYYLIHAMAEGSDFAERDRALANGFARAAEQERVGRIVYLGGLHPEGEDLSPHLASRVEVGQVMLDSEVPAAVLQAAIVLGEGSISFRMLRYLSDRLPVMLAPKWLSNRVQPITIEELLHHLVAAADLPDELNRTFDVGGPDVLTYAEMIRRFAAVTGLSRRRVVTVPVLSPGLASRWIGLVTPLDTSVARPLVDSLVHEVVCRDDSERFLPPPEQRPGFDEAVRSAMAGVRPDHGLRNLALVVAATGSTAVLGSLATRPESAWYGTLDKPSWQPPAPVFPVVWTLLYADLAATSAATLTRLEASDDDEQARAYRRALAVNLTLNVGWNVIFWRARRPALAAAEAALLTLSTADLARRAAAGGPRKGLALVPYAAWSGFATVLTTAIAWKNRRKP